MTIYEATKLEHFKKIVDFSHKFMFEGVPSRCWSRIGRRETSVEALMKEYTEGVEFQVCEDEGGNIRCILSFIYESVEGQLYVKGLSVLIDELDYANGNAQYFKELLAYGAEKCRRLGVSFIICAAMEWFLKHTIDFYGEAYVKYYPSPFQVDGIPPIFMEEINVKRYWEEHG